MCTLDKTVCSGRAEIGEDIDAGQTAGWIHKPEAPWEDATEVVFPITATVLCKRIPGRVQPTTAVSTWAGRHSLEPYHRSL